MYAYLRASVTLGGRDVCIFTGFGESGVFGCMHIYLLRGPSGDPGEAFLDVLLRRGAVEEQDVCIFFVFG